MRIAIAGGTGTLGRHAAEELRARGHEVRVLSRNSPEHRVDLTTGEGLTAALDDCQAVVDASNSSSPKRARLTLVEGSRRLLAAERAAGVAHHVCVSIVGCDLVPMSYYRVKTEQEHLVEAGPVPWSIVRATQFHELAAAALAAAANWRVLPALRVRLQTVASAEVARAVADAAEGAPSLGRMEVAGPETAELRDLARSWRAVTGRHAALVPAPLPGRLGRALREGALTSAHPDVQGTVTFADWLARQ